MSDHIEYQRGKAQRVFDAFGPSGFNVSEDGRLGYFGPGGPWYAKDEIGSCAIQTGHSRSRRGYPLSA